MILVEKVSNASLPLYQTIVHAIPWQKIYSIRYQTNKYIDTESIQAY
jgi:hypothetical protein